MEKLFKNISLDFLIFFLVGVFRIAAETIDEYNSISFEIIEKSLFKYEPTLPEPENKSQIISPGETYLRITSLIKGIKEVLFP